MSKATTVSLRALIWRRFRRRRAGFISGILILAFSLVLLAADFIAPYEYNQQHRRAPSVPPMLGRIHLFDEGGLSLPFVYGLQRQRDPQNIGLWQYEEDHSQRFPIRIFVTGERYRFWGLFETNLHLFGTGNGVSSPGQLFLLGTNQSGVDLFSQILVGGRLSMLLVALVILISFFIGILIGGLSGYAGGWLDTVLQRVIEITMGLPRLALLLALVAAIPAEGSLLGLNPSTPMKRFLVIAGVLALVNWAPLARVIRGQFLALREEDYVFAAKATGAGGARIILRHILPNMMSYLVVSATLAVPSVLILESVLSFLGFGINTPMISWGLLLKQVYDGFVTNLSFYPWLLIPGIFLFATVLAFNLFGDALRDALDPFTVDAGSQM